MSDSADLVLGLNYSGVHDSAIALVTSSGEVLFGCALERVSRVKQDSRPPEQLLERVPWDRVRAIAVSTDAAPWSPVDPSSRIHPVPLITPRREFLAHQQPFYEYLAKLPKPVRFICHHASHAASAFWLSEFNEALCLIYDGGMFNSPWFGGLYRASRSGGIVPLDLFPSSHYAKITSLYSIVTALLGFTPNKHEGKITGLAAYGRPLPRIRELLDQLFTSDYLKMESVAEWLHTYSTVHPAVMFVNPARKAELVARFEGNSREDIAATLQSMAEEHVVELLTRARNQGWTSDSICLAGGLFANVKINQRIQEFGFRQIFVAPPMTDDGTALGAALAVAAESPAFTPKRLEHAFLGPEYVADEIEQTLHRFGLRYTRLENPEESLAERLSEGAVVAVFQGCAEFGPRALGHRSILSQATDPQINARLNARLRRTEFMPFAPITRVEDAHECYLGLEGAFHTAEFMTITCGCTEQMRSQSPAVVHVDGTARPQLVRREVNPLLHGILSAYGRRSGILSLINTSFNVHEEPIVCSPEDAIRGFLETGIDLLYLQGGFLVSFHDNLEAALDRMRVVLAQRSQKEVQLAEETEVLARRLAAIQESIYPEVEALRIEADKRERGLRELTAIITSRDRRISELERIAAERLADVDTMHSAMDALRQEAEKRERGLHELTALLTIRDDYVAQLERIARERLADINTLHSVIDELRGRAAERD